jgi:hypothetical protein
VIIGQGTAAGQILMNPELKSASINLNQRIDLANLEYDDSPYPGRTNIGHIFIPFLFVETEPVALRIGGWYKHVYLQYDENDSPKKMYPYMSAAFHAGKDSEFLIGNFENLAPLPNTIYNEFLYFEERPVSSGLKYSLAAGTFGLLAYMDWLELDTEEHPEEFITGIAARHDLFSWFYCRLYNHYHHRGGQLNKDTHPVRIEQDIATSPVIGFRFRMLYLEGAWYNSMFSQNFEPTIYGHAAAGTLGFFTDSLNISYQCFANKDYYHRDAHPFYLKKENILHRIRTEYNIYRYMDILNVNFTVNLYGIDPPGIDMRLFAKIDLNLIEYKRHDNNQPAAENN